MSIAHRGDLARVVLTAHPAAGGAEARLEQRGDTPAVQSPQTTTSQARPSTSSSPMTQRQWACEELGAPGGARESRSRTRRRPRRSGGRARRTVRRRTRAESIGASARCTARRPDWSATRAARRAISARTSPAVSWRTRRRRGAGLACSRHHPRRSRRPAPARSRGRPPGRGVPEAVRLLGLLWPAPPPRRAPRARAARPSAAMRPEVERREGRRVGRVDGRARERRPRHEPALLANLGVRSLNSGIPVARPREAAPLDAFDALHRAAREDRARICRSMQGFASSTPTARAMKSSSSRRAVWPSLTRNSQPPAAKASMSAARPRPPSAGPRPPHRPSSGGGSRRRPARTPGAACAQQRAARLQHPHAMRRSRRPWRPTTLRPAGCGRRYGGGDADGRREARALVALGPEARELLAALGGVRVRGGRYGDPPGRGLPVRRSRGGPRPA